ncbi:MAG: ABC transporter ATP-binding protein [Ruminococcaceae bacterium]|nr:ABC transporter ATP-binding protein [Oscillospiraceae bacterium]
MKGRRGTPAKDIKGAISRLFKTLFKYYKKQLIIVGVCIIATSLATTCASLFISTLLKYIEQGCKEGLAAVYGSIVSTIFLMAGIYVLGIISTVIYTRLMATVTQGFLDHIRKDMFNVMQNLPIKYFDSHTHGDIMSHYTNDADAIRQLVSQSMPHLFRAALTVTFLFVYMLYFSVWLTLVVILGVIAMSFVTKTVGGNSAKFFMQQQKSVGKVEGYVEEMMNGQKVVKVFCHEDEAKSKFDEINEQLFNDASNANRFANILMPILGNIGNILYVLLAFIGGALILATEAGHGIPNVSLSGMAFVIPSVVPFLNMSRQFCNNVSQLSQQINSVAMGLAGAERIFELMDEKTELDEGYVTLVNAKEVDGEIVECEERTGMWAWKHPHSADGSISYTKLSGDIRMVDVDFGYNEEKIVLHNVTLYAEPGQKVAFVGATGAGKTTITNLINRFYDIADGKIRYDGININKIKKADLRRSLGIVLQDTNLFTATVMENIRYGRLDATDEECIEAAKLANAHDFITRLPDGYNTMLTGDGANLSQGQRQLLSIARAAVADAPVMIMDEATSSIDTRTEALVQKGTDSLMKGRTVFVIAHRLSTVQNSDVIMVLDHGRIIERGSHEKLIEEKGQYYRLYTGAFELE